MIQIVTAFGPTKNTTKLAQTKVSPQNANPSFGRTVIRRKEIVKCADEMLKKTKDISEPSQITEIVVSHLNQIHELLTFNKKVSPNEKNIIRGFADALLNKAIGKLNAANGSIESSLASNSYSDSAKLRYSKFLKRHIEKTSENIKNCTEMWADIAKYVKNPFRRRFFTPPKGIEEVEEARKMFQKQGV